MTVFARFDDQDSGCRSYGLAQGGRRWFVKTAGGPATAAAMTRVVRLHRAVRHRAVVRPVAVLPGPTLVYPWAPGEVLNAATGRGADRSGLARFRREPVAVVRRALGDLLDAHVTIAAAGWVAVDLYDGCFLWDAAGGRLRLVDLDEYRPGPFVLDADRLPGSRRYMAPEEFVRGARIDLRTTVFTLGRALAELLDGPGGWRGTDRERAVVDRATDPSPDRRFADPGRLAVAWAAARP